MRLKHDIEDGAHDTRNEKVRLTRNNIATPGPWRRKGAVAQFKDVRSEPPSHDGVSNLGHPGSFPGGGAGPNGPAPLSPRELLK